MKMMPLLTITTAALLLSACQPKADSGKDTDAAAAARKPVATLNGKSITQGEFDGFVQQVSGRPSAELDAGQKQRALDSLISLKILAAQAEKDGLDKKSELAMQIELNRLNILQQALAEKYLEGKTPTEQELKVEYDAQVNQMSRNEYRARHILVPTEIAATQTLDRLRKGERFEVLAKDSLDSSRDRGGDLGWFSPASMVKPFADAIMALKKGEIIAKPVQTQFGWHVIRLDDVREVQPPPFEEVKQQLNQAVLAKKFRAYSDELTKVAKVEKKI
ncbi:MAG: peptidylprolyl isomerase [Gammaproteobacteria bacterium]|nr:peptidylprolyl isomerase [Gammaproteobacteria bacterium]